MILDREVQFEAKEDTTLAFDGSSATYQFPLARMLDKPASKAGYKRYLYMQDFASTVAGHLHINPNALLVSYSKLTAEVLRLHADSTNNIYIGGHGGDNVFIWHVKPFMTAEFFAAFKMTVNQMRDTTQGGRRVSSMTLEQIVRTTGYSDNLAMWVSGRMLASKQITGTSWSRQETPVYITTLINHARTWFLSHS